MKGMLSAFFAAFATIALVAADLPNLSLEKGVKLSASSYLKPYAPAMAADGDDSAKASRWVSDRGRDGAQWLQISYPAETELNAATIKFWTANYRAVDFDIQVKSGSSAWRTVREIRGNEERICSFAFPDVKCSDIRAVFLKREPDDMVRVYEFETRKLPIPMEIRFPDILYYGGPGRKFDMTIYKDAPENLEISIKTLAGGEIIASKTMDAKVLKSSSFALPPVPDYGYYSYAIAIRRASGESLFSRSIDFCYFPASPAKYLSSSPFGAHFYDMNGFTARHVGLRWLRNHDIYGLWNYYVDDKGAEDWSALRDRLAFVKDNGIRLCYLFIGAPLPYSTILSGEEREGFKASVYSYYPPSDLAAWSSKYLLKVDALVRADAPLFRAYEIWNEAWSYYRLRGLHGTPGEACELFKVSYQTLKKADPDVMVYSADVKPEAMDNRYAFKGFGRDMLDLGFLRYSDLLSYHAYGMGSCESLERIRRNAWGAARYFKLWDTETAVEGRPFYELMESLAIQRWSGVDKMFIYNGSKWAPLMEGSSPTMNLVGMAALIRNLGDALPLGRVELDGSRVFVFANGPTPVALLFRDGDAPAKVVLPLLNSSKITDVFGRSVRATDAKLAKDSPLFVENPALDFVKGVVAAQLKLYAGEASEPSVKQAISQAADRIASAKTESLGESAASVEDSLRKARFGASSDFLYASNKALETLLNLRVMLARSEGKAQGDAPSLEDARARMAALWAAINAKTKGDGALLDAERMASTAQCSIQSAAMYADDKDAVATSIFLAAAARDMALAESFARSEKLSAIYKPKTYFRSHKRFLRSEVFCFPNGRWQEAVITLANPLGEAKRGELELSLPEGWSASSTRIPYEVAPGSRTLIEIKIKAPATFKKDDVKKIGIKDLAGFFPAIQATCEIVGEVPPAPVLLGGISGGVFTGN